MQWRRTPVDNIRLLDRPVLCTSGADLSVAGTALFGGFLSGSKIRQRSLEVVLSTKVVGRYSAMTGRDKPLNHHYSRHKYCYQGSCCYLTCQPSGALLGFGE